MMSYNHSSSAYASYACRVRELQRTLGTSDVVVTEVGYPSAGEACCSYAPTGFPANATFMARPSPSNAAVHLTTLTQTLNTAGEL